jgi:hypothetical protein
MQMQMQMSDAGLVPDADAIAERVRFIAAQAQPPILTVTREACAALGAAASVLTSGVVAAASSSFPSSFPSSALSLSSEGAVLGKRRLETTRTGPHLGFYRGFRERCLKQRVAVDRFESEKDKHDEQNNKDEQDEQRAEDEPDKQDKQDDEDDVNLARRLYRERMIHKGTARVLVPVFDRPRAEAWCVTF